MRRMATHHPENLDEDQLNGEGAIIRPDRDHTPMVANSTKHGCGHLNDTCVMMCRLVRCINKPVRVCADWSILRLDFCTNLHH